MHSTFSDGTFTPEELIAEGQRIGLKAMALTDHDTTNGVPRFRAAAKAAGIRILTGVEVSADPPHGTMHVLGYCVEPEDPTLIEHLKWIRDGRDARNREILHKLNQLGCHITMEQVESHAGEDVVDLVSAVCQTHGIRAHVAVGNCDRAHLEDAPFLASPAGIERAEAPEFVLAGKRCLALHGDNETRLAAALAAGTYDYVFTGHSHAPADQRVGNTRRLNPGSPVRPRRGPPTVALLDLETDQLDWIPV